MVDADKPCAGKIKLPHLVPGISNFRLGEITSEYHILLIPRDQWDMGWLYIYVFIVGLFLLILVISCSTCLCKRKLKKYRERRSLHLGSARPDLEYFTAAYGTRVSTSACTRATSTSTRTTNTAKINRAHSL